MLALMLLEMEALTDTEVGAWLTDGLELTDTLGLFEILELRDLLILLEIDLERELEVEALGDLLMLLLTEADGLELTDLEADELGEGELLTEEDALDEADLLIEALGD